MNTNFLNGMLPSVSEHTHTHTSDNKPALTLEQAACEPETWK